jgi:hypothetical protein
MRKVLGRVRGRQRHRATVTFAARPEEGFAYYPDSEWSSALFVGGYEFLDPPPQITADGPVPPASRRRCACGSPALGSHLRDARQRRQLRPHGTPRRRGSPRSAHHHGRRVCAADPCTAEKRLAHGSPPSAPRPPWSTRGRPAALVSESGRGRWMMSRVGALRAAQTMNVTTTIVRSLRTPHPS